MAEGVASGVAGAVATYFVSNNSQAKPPEQNLITLKADQGIDNEAKMAELKAAIELASEAEIRAEQTLNSNLLNNTHKGVALQRKQTLISNLNSNNAYMVSILHSQQFHNFQISSDGSTAKVYLTERWSSKVHQKETNTIIGYYQPDDISQTIYLQKSADRWFVFAINFQDNAPQLIVPTRQTEPLLPI